MCFTNSFFSDLELVKKYIFFTNSFLSDREFVIFAGSRFSSHVACENRESYGGGGAFTWKTITSAIALGIFDPIYHLACRNKSRALSRMGRGGAMLEKVASATAGGRRGLPVGRQSRLLSLWGHWGQCHLEKKNLEP